MEFNSSPNFVEPILQMNHISGENAKLAWLKKTDSIVEEPFSIFFLVFQGKTSFKVFQQFSTF